MCSFKFEMITYCWLKRIIYLPWNDHSIYLQSIWFMTSTYPFPFVICSLLLLSFLFTITSYFLAFLQLTSEPHMSQGMINFDYKVNYLSFSDYFICCPHLLVVIYCFCSFLVEHYLIMHAYCHHVLSLFYSSILYFSGKGLQNTVSNGEWSLARGKLYSGNGSACSVPYFFFLLL